MYNIVIRFYEELNDFLPKQYRKIDRDFSFKGKRSIKDLIESMGVPHVEVDLILVNGDSVDFTYLVKDGDRISVYPVFERLNVENVTRLREIPLRDIKFVLDVHLRKLAKRLRLLGFDVYYKKNLDDPELAEISECEDRVLLTRDRQLLKRKNVTKGLIIRNDIPEKQVHEVLNRLDLWSMCRPFRRCMECNGTIKPITYEGDEFSQVKKKIPTCVLEWCKDYSICGTCKKIYWQGSHYLKLKKYVDEIMYFSVK